MIPLPPASTYAMLMSGRHELLPGRPFKVKPGGLPKNFIPNSKETKTMGRYDKDTDPSPTMKKTSIRSIRPGERTVIYPWWCGKPVEATIFRGRVLVAFENGVIAAQDAEGNFRAITFEGDDEG